MKQTLLCLFLTSLGFYCAAQDRIITVTQDTIPCKITYVGDETITYTYIENGENLAANLPLTQVDRYVTNYNRNGTSKQYVKHIDGAGKGQEHAVYKPHLSLSVLAGLSILTFKKQGATNNVIDYEQELKYFSHLQFGADLWLSDQVALGINYTRATSTAGYDYLYLDENRKVQSFPVSETHTFQSFTGGARWRFARGGLVSTDLLFGFGVTKINVDFTADGIPGVIWGSTHSLFGGCALNLHITPAIDLQFYPRFITVRPKQMQDEFVGQSQTLEYETYEDRPKLNRLDLSFGITWKL